MNFEPRRKTRDVKRHNTGVKNMMTRRFDAVNQNYEDEDDDYQDDVYDYEKVSAKTIRDFYASKREFEEGKGTPYEFG